MGYTFQAPKVFEDQSAGFKRKHFTVSNLIRKGWLLEHKFDGVFAAISTGQGLSMSRDLNEQFSAKNIVDHYKKALPGDQYVFGELWLPKTEHRVINGMARRKVVQPVQFRAFDCITAAEFSQGKSNRTHAERIALLEGSETEAYQISRPVSVEELLQGKPLSDAALVAKAYDLSQWSEGKDAYDGLIIRDPDALWKPGATKEGEVLKLKGETSLDLKVVGESVSQRATKLGGFLRVSYNGVITDVGSGLTKEQLTAIHQGKYSFIGRVVEVTCLGINGSGALREPRFKSVRHDTKCEEEK